MRLIVTAGWSIYPLGYFFGYLTGAERRLHVVADLVSSGSHIASLTHEVLEQSEAPPSHANCETRPGINEASFTTVAKRKHDNGANQQAPEHALAKVWLHRTEDEVELNHLQRNSDRPVNVAIDDGRAANLDPVLAHVEVMHCCHERHQGANIQ